MPSMPPTTSGHTGALPAIDLFTGQIQIHPIKSRKVQDLKKAKRSNNNQTFWHTKIPQKWHQSLNTKITRTLLTTGTHKCHIFTHLSSKPMDKLTCRKSHRLRWIISHHGTYPLKKTDESTLLKHHSNWVPPQRQLSTQTVWWRTLQYALRKQTLGVIGAWESYEECPQV